MANAELGVIQHGEQVTKKPAKHQGAVLLSLLESLWRDQATRLLHTCRGPKWVPCRLPDSWFSIHELRERRSVILFVGLLYTLPFPVHLYNQFDFCSLKQARCTTKVELPNHHSSFIRGVKEKTKTCTFDIFFLCYHPSWVLSVTSKWCQGTIGWNLLGPKKYWIVSHGWGC